MSIRPVSIPERFLRQLWKRQEFTTASLTSVDGKPISILSSGTLNADAGPDFLDALVKIGNITYRGDVELHQTLQEWKQHAHDKDPRYNRVILHVMFEGEAASLPSFTKSKRRVPLLILKPYLSGPYRDIWQKMILDERAERIMFIKCHGKNNNVDTEIVTSWLKKLAIERMELKVRRFEERLREIAEEENLRIKEPMLRYGTIPFGVNPEELPPPTPPSPRLFTKSSLWSQLLFEGIFEALGFVKNREPFLRLAQNVRLERIHNLFEQFPKNEVIPAAEGLLFGAAGLLDGDIRSLDAPSKQYVQHLRSIWKTIRPTYTREILHPSEWKFFRLRPENFPTVRIAGAVRFFTGTAKANLLKTLIQTMKGEQSSKEKLHTLASMFTVAADGFWQTHYHFSHATKGTLTTLIGKTRANEIIVNVVVPIALLYARMFKDKDVRHGTLQIFQHAAPLAENSVTKIITQQLMHPVYGVKDKLPRPTAMTQQGMLQLYKYYCVEERCAECAVGKVVFRQ
jgi:hypothetical protein